MQAPISLLSLPAKMKKLLLIGLLIASHAQAHLVTIYVGTAQADKGVSVLLPVFFESEERCMGFGQGLANELYKTEKRGMLYHCESLVADSSILERLRNQ
jgi:hypothetical protein